MNFLSTFRFKEEDENQLQREYEMMLEGLRKASEQNDADMFLANPILPDDVLKGTSAYSHILNWLVFEYFA